MLKRGEEVQYASRPLIAPGSAVHTDTASTYMQLHRLKGHERYKRRRYWVTQVRHSRKKSPDGSCMLPVQYVVRKFVQLLSGEWVWRKWVLSGNFGKT